MKIVSITLHKPPLRLLEAKHVNNWAGDSLLIYKKMAKYDDTREFYEKRASGLCIFFYDHHYTSKEQTNPYTAAKLRRDKLHV